MHNSQFTMHNFCDKREQSSLLGLQSGAKITNEVSNYNKGRVSEMKLDLFVYFMFY
jgi:hypothetical protein